MPATVDAEVSSRTEAAVDEAFLAMVCSDEELLRAEFDAIVAAEWDDPPPPSPERHAAEQVGRPAATPACDAHDRLTGGPRVTGGDHGSRQRSPPSEGWVGYGPRSELYAVPAQTAGPPLTGRACSLCGYAASVSR